MDKPSKSRELAVAYNMKKKPKGYKSGGSVGCMDCMSMGGKCVAHGGQVENEDLSPDSEVEMPAGMREDLDAMSDEGDDESKDAKHMARGGSVAPVQSVVDEIMHGRKKKMASGGMLEDEPVESDFEPHVNMEPVHTREDSEHDTESGSLDDESLVGQILKDRKMRRRG